MPSVVSLREIARQAGCAISTASAALSGRGAVAATTVARVREVAARLGYVPDPLRAQLAGGRFRAKRRGVPIAFLRWQDRVTEYERHLRRLLPTAGYDCRVVDVGAGSDLAALRTRLLEQGVQGLIVHRRLALERPESASADWSGLAVVVAATVGPECPYTSHDIGIYEQWLLAWQRMLAAGWRRIGAVCLGRTPSGHEEVLRLAACRHAQARLPAGYPRLPVFTGTYRLEAERLAAWRARTRPQAVITTAAEVAGLWPDLPLLLAGGSRPWGHRHLAQVGPEDERRCQEVLDLIGRLLRERALGPLPHPQRLAISPTWHPGRSLPHAPA